MIMLVADNQRTPAEKTAMMAFIVMRANEALRRLADYVGGAVASTETLDLLPLIDQGVVQCDFGSEDGYSITQLLQLMQDADVERTRWVGDMLTIDPDGTQWRTIMGRDLILASGRQRSLMELMLAGH